MIYINNLDKSVDVGRGLINMSADDKIIVADSEKAWQQCDRE